MAFKVGDWRKKIENINIPYYLKENLEIYFKYVEEGNDTMYLAEIDNVLSSINVAMQEKDLTLEEGLYIRREVVGVS